LLLSSLLRKTGRSIDRDAQCLHAAPSTTRKDEMGRAFSMHGNMINACKILLTNLKERDHSEELGVDLR
jgi:hypothetical protein